jgi:hypothetical protein
MKISTVSAVCLGLALGFFSFSPLGQAENNSPAAGPDLALVLANLDKVVASLAKVSEELANLQKNNGSKAKDKSLKSVSSQLSSLNKNTESLGANLAKQAKASNAATDLLEQLVGLQSAAAKKTAQPATPVKWEYKSIFGDSRVALEEEMNVFGKEGWEFFNITSFGRGSAAFARRPAK